MLVNGQLTSLPAVHAGGDFFGDRSEFFFLDDVANPITLKYRYGSDSIAELTAT